MYESKFKTNNMSEALNPTKLPENGVPQPLIEDMPHTK